MSCVAAKCIVKRFPVTWYIRCSRVWVRLSPHLLVFQRVVPHMSARTVRSHLSSSRYLWIFVFMCMWCVCPHALSARLCNGRGHQLRMRPHLCWEIVSTNREGFSRISERSHDNIFWLMGENVIKFMSVFSRKYLDTCSSHPLACSTVFHGLVIKIYSYFDSPCKHLISLWLEWLSGGVTKWYKITLQHYSNNTWVPMTL